jgi:nucleoside phosphorylase
MAKSDLGSITIDFGVITVREDEYQAVFERLTNPAPLVGRYRTYAVAGITNDQGHTYRIALVRCTEQGPNAAQDTARDLIEDLHPHWLVVVGIAGGFPDDEYTLGDVVVVSRLHDFTVGAYLKDGSIANVDQGAPMAKPVQDLIATLHLLQPRMRGWEANDAIGVPRPSTNLPEDKFYGNEEWRQKTKDALAPYFDKRKREHPIATTRALATDGFLLKDAAVAKRWLDITRDVRAVDMELGGIITAARRIAKEYPVLAIRGLSDIVGFDRDAAWTTYACNSAASFFLALLRVLPAEMLRAESVTGSVASRDVPRLTNPPFIGRSEHLVGISQLLEDALQQFHNPDGRHILGFHGIGGVGKSSLADAIATRTFSESIVRDVVFVRFRGDESEFLSASIDRYTEALRRRLRIGPDEPLSDALRKQPYLIYLDNLETTGEMQDSLVAHLCDLVENTAARVLLTSRRVYADQIRVHSQRLTGLDQSACRELIHLIGRHIPGVAAMSEGDLKEVVTATGGVPLAIKFVIPQLEIDDLGEVLERLRLTSRLVDDEYRDFYSGIIDWSWRQVGKDKRGFDAGSVLVCLAKQPSSPSGAISVPELAKLLEVERSRIKYAINLLFRYSLIEVSIPPDLRAGRRYFVHPLVQQYVEADMLDTSAR